MNDPTKAVFLSHASPAFASFDGLRTPAARQDALFGVGQVSDLTHRAVATWIDVTRTATRWDAGVFGQVTDLTYFR